MSHHSVTPQLGVIEGFYGEPWSNNARRDMIDWLSRLAVHAYLYAPKADPWLRRRWRSPWPREAREALQHLAAHAQEAQLVFGVGLSPFGSYHHYGAEEKRALRDRVLAINDLGVGLLAILFDDMPGDQPDLAAAQAAVMADVAAWSTAQHHLLCPTYYSDDPVLDRVFGMRPKAYLRELAAQLPRDVALFWTGRRVCSETIELGDLPSADVLAQHALALWDNYPVNDSKSRSEHLYLDAVSGRDNSLATALSWHWSNAMNQAALSLPAIASFAALYRRSPPGEREVLAEAGINDELRAACAPLALRRLDQLSPGERARLERCSRVASPAARELRDFLAGKYRFDPACLTD